MSSRSSSWGGRAGVDRHPRHPVDHGRRRALRGGGSRRHAAESRARRHRRSPSRRGRSHRPAARIASDRREQGVPEGRNPCMGGSSLSRSARPRTPRCRPSAPTWTVPGESGAPSTASRTRSWVSVSSHLASSASEPRAMCCTTRSGWAAPAAASRGCSRAPPGRPWTPRWRAPRSPAGERRADRRGRWATRPLLAARLRESRARRSPTPDEHQPRHGPDRLPDRLGLPLESRRAGIARLRQHLDGAELERAEGQPLGLAARLGAHHDHRRRRDPHDLGERGEAVEVRHSHVQTTSGLSARTSDTASRPSAASPTTSTPGAVERMSRSTARNARASSTTRQRIMQGAAPAPDRGASRAARRASRGSRRRRPRAPPSGPRAHRATSPG